MLILKQEGRADTIMLQKRWMDETLWRGTSLCARFRMWFHLPKSLYEQSLKGFVTDWVAGDVTEYHSRLLYTNFLI
jgi:hypothetical protein